MTDVVEGDINQILDGQTVFIRITSQDPENARKYFRYQLVKIVSLDVPPLYEAGGPTARELLEKVIGGRKVRCKIHGIDGNVLHANVEPIE